MPATGSRVCSTRERLSTYTHLHLATILCIPYSSPTTPSTVYFPSLMFTAPTSTLPSSLILTATTSVQRDSEPASRSVYNSEPVYGNSNCWNNNLLDYHTITYSFVHACSAATITFNILVCLLHCLITMRMLSFL